MLKGLNLCIRPNETVALVGESGCGKSTIVSLVMRFYDPDYGKITVDGIDVKDYDLRSLRLTMGLVMQEPTLFNYSIQENILYGKLESKNSEIREAASVANALEFIESKNQKFEFDDSCVDLLKHFVSNTEDLTSMLGKELFEKKLKAIAKLAAEE